MEAPTSIGPPAFTSRTGLPQVWASMQLKVCFNGIISELINVLISRIPPLFFVLSSIFHALLRSKPERVAPKFPKSQFLVQELLRETLECQIQFLKQLQLLCGVLLW